MLGLAVTRGDPAAVEASLGLDQPARRLIQQGLRNEGFGPEPSGDPGLAGGSDDTRRR